MFDLDTNVPMPKLGKPRRANVKWPFDTMEVGDSFFVKSDFFGNTTAKVAANRKNKEGGKRFTTRKVEGGWRCWRIA